MLGRCAGHVLEWSGVEWRVGVIKVDTLITIKLVTTWVQPCTFHGGC